MKMTRSTRPWCTAAITLVAALALGSCAEDPSPRQQPAADLLSVDTVSLDAAPGGPASVLDGASTSPTPDLPPPQAGAPDLVVSAVSWQPKSPQAGDAVTFSATITNQGGAATPQGTILGVRFTVDGVIASWSDHETSALGPGKSVTVTANGGPTGKSSWSASQGTVSVEAWVDPPDRIPNEADEGNNKLTVQLQVGGQVTPPKTGALESPPSMAPGNTVTFTSVCPEDGGWPSASQMAGKDVKIVLPTTRSCSARGTLGGTKSTPAHNIWVVGGKLDYTGPRVTKGTAGLTLINWTGTVFVEGIEIDMNNTCNDGIRGSTAATGGKQRRVVLQSSYFHGIGYCTPTGTHGDLFHAQNQNDTPADSKIAELKLQNVRGDLINQGLFVPYRPQNSHGVRKLVLDRVELRLDAQHKFEKNKISTMIFADGSGSNGDSPPPDGQVYNEVYLNWWDPWYPGTQGRTNITKPSPSSYDAKGCAVFSAATKSSAKITGTWCKGSPPKGTFVPPSKIGLNYKRSHFTGGP